MNSALRTALTAYHDAPTLARLRAWGSVVTRRLEDLERFVPTDGFILDFGGGDGLFSRFLIESSPARRVIAVEPDSRRRLLGERIHGEGVARHALAFFDDLDRIPTQTQFDAAVILDVLYLIQPSDRTAIAEKIGSRLRPGGILIVKEIMAPLAGIQKFIRLQEWIAVRSGFTRGACIRFPTEEELRTFAEHAGCEPTAEKDLPRLWYRYALIAARKPAD